MSAALGASLLPPSVIKMPPEPSVPSICIAIISAALSGLAPPRNWAVHGALLRLLNTAVDSFLASTRLGTAGRTYTYDFLVTITAPKEDMLPSRNVVRNCM